MNLTVRVTILKNYQLHPEMDSSSKPSEPQFEERNPPYPEIP